MNKLFAPFIAIALLGAGCATKPTTPPNEAPKTTTPAPQAAPTEAPPSQKPVAEQASPRALEAAKTDDTWETYTNKALGFTFRWPTKGRYAPEWEVKLETVADPDTAKICIETPNSGEATIGDQFVTVAGKTFCHAGTASTGTTDVTYTDNFATVFGNNLVRIGFIKSLHALEGCTRSNQSIVKNVCVPFEMDEYHAMLDSIVGTFKMTE